MHTHGTTATFLRLTEAGVDAGQAAWAAAAVHHRNLIPEADLVPMTAVGAAQLVRRVCDGGPHRPDGDDLIDALYGDAADAVRVDARAERAVYTELHLAAAMAELTEPGVERSFDDETLADRLAVTAMGLLTPCPDVQLTVTAHVADLITARMPYARPAAIYETFQHAIEIALAGAVDRPRGDHDPGNLAVVLGAAIILDWLWPWACADNPEGLVDPTAALAGPTSPLGHLAEQVAVAAAEKIGGPAEGGPIAAAILGECLYHLGEADPWTVDPYTLVGEVIDQLLADSVEAIEAADDEEDLLLTAVDELPTAVVASAVWDRLVAPRDPDTRLAARVAASRSRFLVGCGLALELDDDPAFV